MSETGRFIEDLTGLPIEETDYYTRPDTEHVRDTEYAHTMGHHDAPGSMAHLPALPQEMHSRPILGSEELHLTPTHHEEYHHDPVSELEKLMHAQSHKDYRRFESDEEGRIYEEPMLEDYSNLL